MMIYEFRSSDIDRQVERMKKVLASRKDELSPKCVYSLVDRRTVSGKAKGAKNLQQSRATIILLQKSKQWLSKRIEILLETSDTTRLRKILSKEHSLQSMLSKEKGISTMTSRMYQTFQKWITKGGTSLRLKNRVGPVH